MAIGETQPSQQPAKTSSESWGDVGPRLAVAARQPPYCECARFAKRPLSWLTWIPVLSQNPLSNLLQIELSHEHLVFDESRDNIGFGEHGLFTENVDALGYRYESECFDGELMRKAVVITEPPSWFGGIVSNCQWYVAKLRDTYESLLKR